MPKTQIVKAVQVNRSILAFTPRQVLLSSKPPASSMKLDDGNNNNNKTQILNPEQKTLLFHSIANYLERSGFSKALKKFCSEAKIQKNDLIDSSFDLEVVFSKFLDMCNNVAKNSESHKVLGVENKKKTDKSAEENPAHDTISAEVKSKEKKRNKKKKTNLDSEAVIVNAGHNSVDSLHGPTEEKPFVVVLQEDKQMTASETDIKSKDKKKKKKNHLFPDPVVEEGKPKKIYSGKDDVKIPKEDTSEKQNKSSKKRKRVVSEECAPQSNDENLVEVFEHVKTKESKRRKTEGSEEPKVKEQSAELNSLSRIEVKPLEEGSSKFSSGEAEKISPKHISGLLNGSLQDNGKKSSMKKLKMQYYGSTEPKSVKHFQRIKVDDVVFSDEKLKDNSYWAKDGAEIGYGAKAEEILGQVRGRDFRHEKTKKKRGSYRGGQIDLQSHSVKFNYSDDD